MNKLQARAGLLIDLILGLIIGGFLAEGYLRYMNVIPSQVQGSHIILQRNHVYRLDHINLRGTDGRLIHTRNSLGFRGPEPMADFNQRLTIIAVGDSTTECFYLSDGKTWPERLQVLLEKENPTVWVNNAGLDGHSTFGHDILLREDLLAIKPRVILFMVGLADVGHEDLNVEDLKMARPSRRRQIEAWIEEHSRLATFASNTLRTLLSAHGTAQHGNIDVRQLPIIRTPAADYAPVIAEHTQRYLPGYEKRLRGLVELCRQNQIVPVLITQPVLYGPAKDDVTGVDLGQVAGPEGVSGAASWTLLNSYDNVTRRVAHDLHVPLIDLARELPKSTLYFYDYDHFTNAGAEAAAEIIHRDLLPVLPKNR